ncbi:hypothetical protein, partial [Photobacterium leiognathi]|uniref:hypothetical protein n=1 Tax=Photobacterium leiognathi TaxID=553611 RepID=UPI0027366A51
LISVQLQMVFNQVIPTSVSSFRIYRETLYAFFVRRFIITKTITQKLTFPFSSWDLRKVDGTRLLWALYQQGAMLNSH